MKGKVSTLVKEYKIFIELASLISIIERESGVGKLGWHGNSKGFYNRKRFFSDLEKEKV